MILSGIHPAVGFAFYGHFKERLRIYSSNARPPSRATSSVENEMTSLNSLTPDNPTSNQRRREASNSELPNSSAESGAVEMDVCVICLKRMMPNQSLVDLNCCQKAMHKICFNQLKNYAKNADSFFNLKCPFCSTLL